MPGRFLEWGRSPESGSVYTCICVCLCMCIYKHILYTHTYYINIFSAVEVLMGQPS